MAKFFLYLMALLYMSAGVLHFAKPNTYVRIMPPWVPYPLAMVYISGACELLFGLLLFPPATRPYAAWLIIALLIAVFPANIQMAINYYRRGNPYLWVAIIRLPLQLLLIWWAWLWRK